MFSERSTLSRLVAAVLPFFFVWAFAACVMICTEHAAEASKQFSTGSHAEADIANEEDCCPMSNPQLSVLPDRPPTGVEVDNHPALRAQYALLVKARGPASHTIPIRSSTDPPFEQLVPLRI